MNEIQLFRRIGAHSTDGQTAIKLRTFLQQFSLMKIIGTLSEARTITGIKIGDWSHARSVLVSIMKLKEEISESSSRRGRIRFFFRTLIGVFPV